MNQTPTEQLVAVEADSVLVDDTLSHVHHFDSFWWVQTPQKLKMIPSDAANERPNKRASRSRSRERARLSGEFQRKHAMTTWRWVKIGVVMDPCNGSLLALNYPFWKGVVTLIHTKHFLQNFRIAKFNPNLCESIQSIQYRSDPVANIDSVLHSEILPRATQAATDTITAWGTQEVKLPGQ